MEISTQDQLKKEIADLANELMADWPSSRNKQKQFVLEYVAVGFTNASKAARNAGYSKKNANKTASNMINGVDKYRHIPPVINELKEAFEERNEELKIADGTEVLQRLTSIGRQLPSEKYYRSEKEIDGLKTVEENKYVTTPSDEDALKALELLGKNYALFTDKQEIDADLGLEIVIDYGDEE